MSTTPRNDSRQWIRKMVLLLLSISEQCLLTLTTWIFVNMNVFMTSCLKDGESVFNFNRRFGNMYHNLVGSGQTVKEVDWIRVYLRALRQHPDSRILYKVKSMIRDLERGKYDSLVEMQQVLVKKEENAQTQGCQTEPRYEITSKSGARQVVVHANQAQ